MSSDRVRRQNLRAEKEEPKAFLQRLPLNTRKKFQGIDYCELGEAFYGRKVWGPHCETYEDEGIPEMVEVLRCAQSVFMFEPDDRSARKVAQVLRAFLLAMSKRDAAGDDRHVWKALLKVSDERLMQFADATLEMMWV